MSFTSEPEVDLVGMPVVVTVDVGDGACHFFDGDDAAVGFSAADVLELDGGVADVVVVLEHVVEVDENAGAFRWRDISNGDVAGERA